VEGGFIFCDFLNDTSRDKYRHLASNKTYFEAGQVKALALEAGFRNAQVLSERERRVQLLFAQR
jgi:hypothetical protein